MPGFVRHQTLPGTPSDSGDGRVSHNAWGEGHLVDMSAGVLIYEEFFGDPSTLTSTSWGFAGGLTIHTTGSGAQVVVATGEANHPGVCDFQTGTTATGHASIHSNATSAALLGGGTVRYGCIMKMPVLSDGTNTFSITAGFSDGLSRSSCVDGVLFGYDSGVNGGKWQAITRSNSTETAQDTGVTADTGWHRYEFIVNATGTSVGFYIDGTLVSTVTTNIPVGTGRETRLVPMSNVKSLGSTSRSVLVDAYYYQFEFTTPR